MRSSALASEHFCSRWYSLLGRRRRRSCRSWFEVSADRTVPGADAAILLRISVILCAFV